MLCPATCKATTSWEAHHFTRIPHKSADGVHMHYVDRTNTDAKILHCKVAEVKPEGTYRLYCEHRLLKGAFAGCDLVDLTSSE